MTKLNKYIIVEATYDGDDHDIKTEIYDMCDSLKEARQSLKETARDWQGCDEDDDSCEEDYNVCWGDNKVVIESNDCGEDWCKSFEIHRI